MHGVINPVAGSWIDSSPGAIGFAFGHVRRWSRGVFGLVSLSPLFIFVLLICKHVRFRFLGDGFEIWLTLGYTRENESISICLDMHS